MRSICILAGVLTVVLGNLLVERPAFAQCGQVRVSASDPGVMDYFGASSSMNGDTMVIGAVGDDGPAGADQGSVYVFRWSGFDWTQEAKLTATGAAAGEALGSVVDIDGNIIVIGAPNYLSNRGRVLIFVRTPGTTTWTQQAVLTGEAAGHKFGAAVSISGDSVVIGATGFGTIPAPNTGAAYVYTRAVGATTWSQDARIVPVDASNGDQFGAAIELSSDQSLIGAPNQDISGRTDQGSAYYYTRSTGGTAWTQRQKLTAGDGLAGDNFGASVGLPYSSVALVGAPHDDGPTGNDQGSAYYFLKVLPASPFTQQQKIVALDPGAFDGFGFSLSAFEGTVVIGAPTDDGRTGFDEGSAEVWELGASNYAAVKKLVISGAAAFDNLGWSVGIWGDRAVVGRSNVTLSQTSQGAAHVYRRTRGTWDPVGGALGSATESLTGDRYGSAVATSGTRVVVGAAFDTVTQSGQGSAYVYSWNGSVWVQEARLVASDAAASDQFGATVAIDGDTIAVGSPYANAPASNQGAVYIFTRTPGTSTWMQRTKIVRADGGVDHNFGYTVSLHAGTLVVGVPARPVAGNPSLYGAVYVYTGAGPTWSQQGFFDAMGRGNGFGLSVSVYADTFVATSLTSVQVFTRSGGVWIDRGALVSCDLCTTGILAAMHGSTIVVGIPDAGIAEVYAGSGATWTLQATLRDPSGTSDCFGCAVSVFGDVVLIGDPLRNQGQMVAAGDALLYIRAGSEWHWAGRFNAEAYITGDGRFGTAVAVGSEALVVGAPNNISPSDQRSGITSIKPLASTCFAWVSNPRLAVPATSIGAALVSAQNGDSIAPNWSTADGAGSEAPLDFAGKAVALKGMDGLSLYSNTSITLAEGASIQTAGALPFTMHGSLVVPVGVRAALANIGRTVSLGNRGTLRLRSGSILTVSAPGYGFTNRGATTLDAGSILTSDSYVNSGIFTTHGGIVDIGSSLFHNIRPGLLTGWGDITGQVVNFSGMVVQADMQIAGAFTNSAGANCTVQNGTLTAIGGITNNGTLVGDTCCRGFQGLFTAGDFVSGSAASLVASGTSAFTVSIGGNFDCAINSNTRFGLSVAELRLSGLGEMVQTLEAMCTDRGADPAGLDPALPGNYPIGTLRIGPPPSSSVVALVDARDNDDLGQATCEAIYCNTLVIEAGATLNTAACPRIYYNTLLNQGVVTNPAKLVHLPQCGADFNNDGSVNSQDFFDFLAAFFLLLPAADFNHDTLINSQDFFDFLAAFFAGC